MEMESLQKIQFLNTWTCQLLFCLGIDILRPLVCVTGCYIAWQGAELKIFFFFFSVLDSWYQVKTRRSVVFFFLLFNICLNLAVHGWSACLVRLCSKRHSAYHYLSLCWHLPLLLSLIGPAKSTSRMVHLLIPMSSDAARSAGEFPDRRYKVPLTALSPCLVLNSCQSHLCTTNSECELVAVIAWSSEPPQHPWTPERW